MNWNPFKRTGPPDAHLVKIYDELCAEDFEQHAAWIESHVHDFGNPLYEDLSEEAVRPWDGEYPVPLTARCMFRATFQAQNGLTFAGVARHWANADSHEHCVLDHHPCIYMVNGDVINFWHGGVYMFGNKWLEADKESFYRTFNLDADSAFPLTYSVPDSLITGGIEGTIPGFGYFSASDVVTFTT